MWWATETIRGQWAGMLWCLLINISNRSSLISPCNNCHPILTLLGNKWREEPMFTMPNWTSKLELLKYGLFCPSLTHNAPVHPWCCQMIWTTRLLLHPMTDFLVLLVSSLSWIPSGKVQTNTPKGALRKLKAKPWRTSCSSLPLNIPISFPGSYPHTVPAPEVNKLVGHQEETACSSVSLHNLGWQKSGFWNQPPVLAPRLTSPSSPHLGFWTYSLLEFPPETINFACSYYFLCQTGGIKTPPNTHTDLFSPEGTWSSLLSLEGTNISRYKVPD